jgi:hypothetical protein
MRHKLVLACAGALFAALPCLAQPLTGLSFSPIYDAFNHPWLDPARWEAGMNHCWSNNLECVREIEHGKLRLATRNTGSMGSDTGPQYSESYLPFPMSVAGGITSIRADITVRDFGGVPCPANADDSTHTEVKIGGNFFNAGAGDPADDVTGLLIVWVDTTTTPTMSLGVWWGFGPQGSWTPIVDYPLGTPLVAVLQWDQPNHQFVATVKVKGEPGPGTRVTSPYGVSDETPAANPWKALIAATCAMNCTSVLSLSHVDALFDNVIINR